MGGCGPGTLRHNLTPLWLNPRSNHKSDYIRTIGVAVWDKSEQYLKNDSLQSFESMPVYIECQFSELSGWKSFNPLVKPLVSPCCVI